MPLSDREILADAQLFRKVIFELNTALAKDEDGKVRLTRKEAGKIIRVLINAVIAILFDVLDYRRVVRVVHGASGLLAGNDTSYRAKLCIRFRKLLR